MAFTVYVSRTSGNMEIKKQQEHVFQVFDSRGIEFDEIDISDPAKREERTFMWKHATAQPGQRNPLPPQIFQNGKYIGDFEAFHLANEDDNLFEFLGLERPDDNPQNGYVESSQVSTHTDLEEDSGRPADDVDDRQPSDNEEEHQDNRDSD